MSDDPDHETPDRRIALAARRRPRAALHARVDDHQRPRRLRLGDVGRRADAPLPRPAGRGASGAARPHVDAEPPRRGACASTTAAPARSPSPEPSLQDVRFVNGRPRWRFAHGDVVLEKSIVMPHRQNTTHVSYRLLGGDRRPIALVLEPAFDIRPHEGAASRAPGRLQRGGGASGRRDHVAATSGSRRCDSRSAASRRPAFARRAADARHRLPRSSARAATTGRGSCNASGSFEVRLGPGEEVTLVVSTESWEQIEALSRRRGAHAGRRAPAAA